MTKRLSLRVRLRHVIILTGISFYLLASLIVAAVEIKKKRSDYASAMITTVKTCEAIIIDYINQYHEYIQYIIVKMPDSAESVVKNYFRENLHFQNLRDMYYILDYHNRIIHIQRPYEQYQGINLSHIEYISEKISVSKVHQSLFSQQPVVSFLYPLAGNKLLVLEKDLKGIIPLVEHFNLGEILKGGYLFILSANGTVVYHPDSQLIDSRHNLGFELTDWSNPDARGLQTFTYHDKKYLCCRITLEKPIGWTLYFVVPNTELFQAIVYRVGQIFLIFAAVFSFLIFFLQFMVNKNLSNPVSEIVTSIANRKLDGTDEPIDQREGAGTKELISIIDAINNMMAALNRSNKNLRESEQRHRTLVETMTDVVFTLDTHGKFTFLNPEFEKLVGYSVQDFIGRPFNKILAPEYIESTDDKFRRGLSGETIPIYEVEVIHKYGKRIPVELNVTSLLDAYGKTIGRIGVARDISERKQAKDALQQSEERYRGLVENSFDGIFVQKDSKIIFTNQRLNEMLGYEKGELLGLDHWLVYHPDYQEVTKKRAQARMRGEKVPQQYEVKLQRKDGSWFFGEINARVISVEEEPGIQVWIRDINERKQTEEALRVSETQKKAILDGSIDRIRLVDTDMRILWANKTTARELNITPEELIGQFCYEAFVGRDSPCTECLTKKALKSGNIEHDILHQPYSKGIEGETYWDAYTVPVKNDAGDIVNCIQVARNITNSKKAEEALRESEERLQTILDSIHAGIVCINAETHTIVDANPAAIEMIGAPKEQILGHVCHKYICPAEEGKCPITDLGQKVDNSERILLTASGAEVPILKTVTPILLSGQAHLLDIFINLTEKKKLEAQLQQAQKMEAIGTLAGGIAHNFNNILMAIEGYVSLMLLDIHSTHPHRKSLEGIEKQIQSGAELTKQLLGFARGGKYEITATNLNELIKTQNRMLGRTKKEITICEKYQENLWIVNVDRGQIEQVILNLYVNAWQAMPRGGNLYVQTENVTLDEDFTNIFNVDPGRYVKISVTDNGVGMDEETQRRIFEPFFTTKEMGKGTGLGLASVYGIIKNHDGIINVDSIKGEGTTFSIYLPVLEEEVIKKEELHEEILKGKETVLLVDDEDVIIDVGRGILKTLGYKVVIARGGEEAIEIYKKSKDTIDIVILDMIMPSLGGGETFDRLKEIYPDIKVLLSSGYSINGQATEILTRGCNGFIQKPFDIKQLGKKMREILDN